MNTHGSRLEGGIRRQRRHLNQERARLKYYPYGFSIPLLRVQPGQAIPKSSSRGTCRVLTTALSLILGGPK